MITEIKMEVTEDLSKRVQEIILAKGGGEWESGGIKITNTNKRYLYLTEDKVLLYGNKSSYFKAHKYKEVSPYDFIVSQGEQEKLPRYGEICEFSDYEDFQKAVLRKFAGYMLHNDHVYVTLGGPTYRYCRPAKTKTIVIDGEKIEVSIKEFESFKKALKTALKGD